MFLQELFITEGPQTVAFCWGRFQPPHRAHGELFNKLAQVGTYDYWICASQTQGPKDPLDYATKMNFIKLQHPKLASHVLEDPSIKTIYQAVVAIYNKYDPKVAESLTLVFVGDETRVNQFVPGFQKFNGVEGKHGFYKFGLIAGETTARDADSDTDAGVTDPNQDISKLNPANISGSLVRNLAAAGDFEKFKYTVSKTGNESWVADLFAALGGKDKDMEESSFRDRERNVGVEHERNNYAVYINGKPWKVFADQRQAMNIARSLQMKGKDVKVYPTGANPSESIEEAKKKPNATTRHLRDHPVSDKDVAKPVKKPEKKKPEQGMAEEKQKGVDGKACWKGYKRMGTKKKGGRTVDNCVKMESTEISEKKNTVKVPVTQKPRQGPLRPQTGGGKHKDKKKEFKQGQGKHKQKLVDLGESWNKELGLAISKLLK